jgi:hypothetical protein
MTTADDQGRKRLVMALACTRLEFPRDQEPVAVTFLKRWLGSWGGIGRVAVGMARQGYDLQLARYADEGWRATFYVSGKEHSAPRYVGSAWEPTPWRAVQVAAREALRADGRT